MHNKNTLIVTMHSDKSNLRAQVYYAKQGHPFTEETSSINYKIKKDQYYFNIPKLTEIQYVRFDPAKQETNISISHIEIVRDKWFKTRIYTIPIKNVLPNHKIHGLGYKNNAVYFTTEGRDPQLNIKFLYQEISVTYNYHIELLLIALLLYMVFRYLYFIYTTHSFDQILLSKLILYTLFLFFALFKGIYYKDEIRFGYPPDELAHLSYIEYVHTHKELLPQFENMVMINNQKSGNYLSHPPLYYQIMNTVYNENYSIVKNVDNFRTLNIIIFMASFLLLLYLGFSSQFSLLGDLVYLSVISSLPMVAYLGASITNDNLAMLGALIFILGFKRILEKDYTNISYFLVALGGFIAYFSKLTAALLVFFCIILFILYIFKTKEKFKISKMQFMLLIVFIIPILYYQWYIISHYHALVPTFDATHPAQYLVSGFYTPEEFRHYLSKYEWLQRMQQYIIEGWFGIHSHHSLIKNNILDYSGILILHIFALIMLFVPCHKKTSCLLGKITLLSLILLMIIQYIFSYKAHLHSGYLGGLQPRYLLPFMFSFAIMSALFVERFKHYFVFSIIIILLCIHTIYSDFFYFLQYYH